MIWRGLIAGRATSGHGSAGRAGGGEHPGRVIDALPCFGKLPMAISVVIRQRSRVFVLRILCEEPFVF
jgi:hypothetical protein